MAMDRERLLGYFLTHYSSRREVLFRLPLNINIESFWPELLKRRKARASVLPLHDAAGMPYWYVLTDRMIAASERLCEEALKQDIALDPYNVSMTSAMTEEMFFTSFVEGAQITFEEAMDFLQGGAEPENISEQMIWNNRQAWSQMIGILFRPLDEHFVRAMAYMLTEGMDNCAEDYRQTDYHPIAAMNDEPYDVPPASSIPERMNEYYDFLCKPDVHPLIKAAVAQAYLLVARPFPEGNERLSRMMSSAVLMRCGYDFFRDISISAMIARESYSYYKSMCEIIRSENGGDLTYFIEYYLELLVRALDDRKERMRQRDLDREREEMEREREALERERKMGKEPLKRGETDEEGIIDCNQEIERDMPLPGSDKPDDGIIDCNHDSERDIPFSESSGSDKLDDSIIDWNQGVEHDMPFSGSDKSDPNTSIQPDTSDFSRAMAKLDASPSENRRLIATTIRRIQALGINRFTRQDWMTLSGTDLEKTRDACDYMVTHNMIYNIVNRRGAAIYMFVGTSESLPPKTLEQVCPGSVPKTLPNTPAQETVAPDSAFPDILSQEVRKNPQEVTTTDHPVTKALLSRLREITSDESPSRAKTVSNKLMELIGFYPKICVNSKAV